MGASPSQWLGAFWYPSRTNPLECMQFQPPSQDDLGFLKTYKVDDEIFTLSSGVSVLVQKYFLHFKPWMGASIPNTYNGKAVIDWNGEPVFAELAVLRMFQSEGWSGVWVDSYRRKYRTGLPDVTDPVDLPEPQKQLIETIRSKTGKHGGCWDVFLWKGDEVLFIELKRLKKDKIQESQTGWFEKTLESEVSKDSFAILEWNIENLEWNIENA